MSVLLERAKRLEWESEQMAKAMLTLNSSRSSSADALARIAIAYRHYLQVAAAIEENNTEYKHIELMQNQTIFLQAVTAAVHCVNIKGWA